LRVESREVVNTDVVKKIISDVVKYAEELQKSVNANYSIVEVRINLKENRVFVIWEDYSDEESKVKQLIEKYVELKQRLEDPIKQPSLMCELIKIADEFKKITGINIEEVV